MDYKIDVRSLLSSSLVATALFMYSSNGYPIPCSSTRSELTRGYGWPVRTAVGKLASPSSQLPMYRERPVSINHIVWGFIVLCTFFSVERKLKESSSVAQWSIEDLFWATVNIAIFVGISNLEFHTRTLLLAPISWGLTRCLMEIAFVFWTWRTRSWGHPSYRRPLEAVKTDSK